MRETGNRVGNKQKPMISAMFSSPGPACVGRIEPDKGIRYSFGLKPKSKIELQSPGPAAYKIHDKSTRHGKDGTPKYSLSGRLRNGNTFITPAPDAYHVESVKILKQNTPPSYSFGSRTTLFKKQEIPGPNAYSVPPLFGTKIPMKSSAPSFSMSGRGRVGGFSEDLKKTPGPGAYKVGDTNSWKVKAPCYSISGRFMMPGDSTQKPGPSSYSPQLSKSHSGFSFGVRHSEYIAPLIV